MIEHHQFATIPIAGDNGEATTLGFDASKLLWQFFKENGYVDAYSRIQDSLRKAMQEETLVLPDQFAVARQEILRRLHRLAGRLEIKDADERRSVCPHQAILSSVDFKTLWDRIKYKTTYRVAFNSESLINKCIRALRDAPAIPKTRLQWRKADIAVGKSGVVTKETEGAATIVMDETDIELPDVLTELQYRTQLTRRSIQGILSSSQRLNDYKRNPQQFIEMAGQLINRCKSQELVDGIKYRRLGSEHYYAQELFENVELTGYLRNMLVARKSVYESVIYESSVEARFADQLEKNTAIKVYTKLPGWFTVPTPLGSYNPDWAVLIDSEQGERLYLVVETKSSLSLDDLHVSEGAKVKCGKAHFSALRQRESPVRYEVANSLEGLLATVDESQKD